MTWQTDMALDDLRAALNRMDEVVARNHRRNADAMYYDFGAVQGNVEIARKALAKLEGSLSPTPTTDE